MSPRESPAIEIRSARLRIIRTDADALANLISGAPEPLEQRFGIRFERPFAMPPLMDDAMPFVLERMRDGPGGDWWSPWLFCQLEDGQAVGAGGFAGPADDHGAVQIGYSLWERQQGRGFATEAVKALLDWALGHEEIQSVRATIPPWNEPSVRVATKVGMQQVGVGEDDEVGVIHIYEIVNPRSG